MAERWWTPPRLHAPHELHAERRVTWLELFYDLVYVASIIQLGNRLSDDVSLTGFVGFALLFIPIWWSWTGMTFFVNRFIADDVWHRLLIFLQIGAISALAINVQGGLGGDSRLFALSYVAVRLVLVLQYVRAAIQVVSARPLASRMALGFAAAALIWFGSAFVPEPTRYGFWVVGMLVDFAVPLLPRVRDLVKALPPHLEHMAERYGLFTIIVLGESFVKVIDGAAHEEHLTSSVLVFGLLALAVACSLWWVYFDDTARARVSMTGNRGFVWIYSHLPLNLGLTAFGVSMKKVVLLHGTLPDNYRWLFCGAVALYMAAIALIDMATLRTGHRFSSAARARVRIISAALVLLLAVVGGAFSPVLLVGLVALVCVAQVLIDLSLGAGQPEMTKAGHTAH